MFRTFNLRRWFNSAPHTPPEATLETALAPAEEGDVAYSQALREPAADAVESGAAVDDDIAARLARIWEKLLGVEGISLDENYFDLGGDSSVTIQLFVQIEKVFGVKLAVTRLFEAPTVAELSAVLRAEMSALNQSR